MLNKKLIMLAIFLVSLLAVSAVNAADNATSDVVSVEGTTDAISVDEADEVVSAEDNQVILGNESDVGTFDELSNLIENTSEGGTLELDRDYKYVNGSNEGIQINKPIIIDGKGHILDSNQLSRVFYVNANNVVLKDITLKNACIKDNGGAIIWSGNDGVINSCNFVNCSNLINPRKDSYSGGAIYLTGNNMNISYCNFTDNKAWDGASIAISSLNSYISCCNFINNFAQYRSGAISIHGDNHKFLNCNFINNTAEDMAGVIEAYGDSIELRDCLFLNNSGNYVGSVMLDGYDNYIYGCNFTNNFAQYDGVLYLACSYDSYVINCTFKNNYVNEICDALYICECGNIYIMDCDFINPMGNLCTISLVHYEDIYLSYCSFYPELGNIEVSGSGDVVNIIKKDSYLTMNNYTVNYGDGIVGFALLKNYNNVTFFSNYTIIFELSNGDVQRAFYSTSNKEGMINLPNELSKLECGTWNVTVTFQGNDNYAPCNTTSTINVLPASSSVTIDDVNTTWDQETNFTAKILSDNKTVNEGTVSFYIDDKFIGNASVINGTATLTHEAPGDAGIHVLSAIYNSINYLSSNGTAKIFVGTGDIEVEDYNSVATFKALADLIENTPEGSVLKLTKDYKNFHNRDYGSIILKSITIDGQGHTIDALNKGSIFGIYGSTVKVLKNINFVNSINSAVTFEGRNGSFINCSFINCTSNYVGAAINMGNNSNGLIYDCIFINNAVNNGYGGAIYGGWDVYNCSMKNCIFINNTANNSKGGAIYLEHVGNCNITNCTFENNRDESLNAVYLDSSSGNMVDCYFVGLDNVWINNDFNFIKRNSILLSNDYNSTFGVPVCIIALLKDSDNKYIINKTIIFKLNDYLQIEIDTDSEGVGELKLENLSVGIWNVTVFCNEDANYYSSESSSTIIINAQYSSLIIDNFNGTVGHDLTISVNVTSPNNLTINEGIVTFFDGETNIGESQVTNGTATLNYAPATAGEHTIIAIFNSTNYLSSNSTAELLVDSATVDVLVDNGTVGYNSTFVANVKGLYSTINEGSVAFYIGGEYLGSVPVVDGVASLVYTPLTVGDFTVKAVFSGSDNFLDDENTTIFTVKQADSEIIINNLNGTVGHELTITVNLVSSNNLTINEGYVTFFDGSTQIGEANVVEGVATLSYTPTTAGEHPITAMFYSTNYGDPINSALLTVAKADIDLSIDYINDVYFTNPSNFVITINSNSKPLSEGKIKYYVNGQLVGTVDVYEGIANFDYVTATTGSFILTAAYEESDNYFAKNVSTTFTVNKMPTTLSGESVIFDEESYKTFTTELKDNTNNGVGGQPVKIEVIKYSGESATFNGISDANGITVYDVGRLAGGMWYVTGVYTGNDNYIESRFVDKFLVVRMNTTTEIEEIDNPKVNHNYKLKANIHDENGKLVKEGIVQFYLDGVDIGSIDLSNNQGHQSSSGDDVLGVANPTFEYVLGADNDVSDLYINYVPTKAGKHTLTAVYEGTTIYKASNSTTSFDVSNSNTVETTITAADVTTVYNGGKYIVITLKDVNGKLVNGVKVKVVLNKKTYTPTTKNGQVKISTNGLAPVKTYAAKITFAGNNKYDKATKSVKVSVKKATPKLTAKAKTFKKSVKTKNFVVTLKTNQNKVMKNTKVTLKVNGKTYSAKTNTKGQATFKITKLTKKGKFTATIKYAGSKYYNAKTVKAKITVK